jgi:hypothetical protein
MAFLMGVSFLFQVAIEYQFSVYSTKTYNESPSAVLPEHWGRGAHADR